MENAAVDQHLKTKGDEEEEINFILTHDVVGDLFDIDTPLDDDEVGSLELRPAHMPLSYETAGSHDGAPSLFLPAAVTRDEDPTAPTSSDRRSGCGAIAPRSPPAARTRPSAGPRSLAADAASSRARDDGPARRAPPPELRDEVKECDVDDVAGLAGPRPHREHAVITPRSPSAAIARPQATPRMFDVDAALPMVEDEQLWRLARDAPPQELQVDFKDFDFDRVADIEDFDRAKAALDVRGTPNRTPTASNRFLAPTVSDKEFDFDRVAGIEDFDGAKVPLDVCGTPNPTSAASHRPLAPTMLGQRTQELNNYKDAHSGQISAEDWEGGSRPATLPRRTHAGAGELHASATTPRHSHRWPLTHPATAWTEIRRSYSAPFHPVSLPPPVDLFPSAAVSRSVPLSPFSNPNAPASPILQRTQELDNAKHFRSGPISAKDEVLYFRPGPLSTDDQPGPISTEDGEAGSRPATLPQRNYTGAHEWYAAAVPTRHVPPRSATHPATAWAGRRSYSATFPPTALPPPVDPCPSAALPPVVHRTPLPGPEAPAGPGPLAKTLAGMAAAREKHLARFRKADRAVRRARNAARARSQVVHVAKGPDRREGNP